MALTSSAGPFYAKDSNGTLQKIKVVDVATDLIAGYSFVDATGSLLEKLQNLENLSTNSEVEKFKNPYIIKNYFSNIDRNEKYKLIDWDNANSGSFRICAADPDRKYVTIYNDSDKDLFISLENDLNSMIEIDFADAESIKKLVVQYKYYNGVSDTVLFRYTLEDLQNIHKFFSIPNDSRRYGYGKFTIINDKNIKIYLTPEYCSEYVNKELQTISQDSGYYEIFLSSSENGIESDVQQFNLTSDIIDEEYLNRNYKIYAKISGSQFLEHSFTTGSKNILINGFDFTGIGIQSDPASAPENYSYIIFQEEILMLNDKEATLPIFGYLIKPEIPADTKLIVRVTETK